MFQPSKGYQGVRMILFKSKVNKMCYQMQNSVSQNTLTNKIIVIIRMYEITGIIVWNLYHICAETVTSKPPHF
jgi:hypothetical protein